MLMASTNSGVMANAPPIPKLLKSDKLELIFVSNEMDFFETKTMEIQEFDFLSHQVSSVYLKTEHKRLSCTSSNLNFMYTAR
jgi:hypothetical protein